MIAALLGLLIVLGILSLIGGIALFIYEERG